MTLVGCGSSGSDRDLASGFGQSNVASGHFPVLVPGDLGDPEKMPASDRWREYKLVKKLDTCTAAEHLQIDNGALQRLLGFLETEFLRLQRQHADGDIPESVVQGFLDDDFFEGISKRLWKFDSTLETYLSHDIGSLPGNRSCNLVIDITYLETLIDNVWVEEDDPIRGDHNAFDDLFGGPLTIYCYPEWQSDCSASD